MAHGLTSKKEQNMAPKSLSSLKLVVDNSNELAPLENLLDEYADEIEVQRAQLMDDLAYFQNIWFDSWNYMSLLPFNQKLRIGVVLRVQVQKSSP